MGKLQTKMKRTIILDPGHGMGNKSPGVFDPGAVSNGIREADIVMDWANVIRELLIEKGHDVVRTRVDHKDPCAISQRAKIAERFGGAVMLSIHCNWGGGKVSGTETFFRGLTNKPKAQAISDAVSKALGTKNRGAKNESQSQHARLAVMAFQPCFLLEIGFIDNDFDRSRMIDPAYRRQACNAIADELLSNI